MKNIKKLTESQLNRIIKKVISEIAAPQMPQAPQNDRMSEMIAEIEREGYKAQNRGDVLYVKFASKGKNLSNPTDWSKGMNYSQSDARQFFSILMKIAGKGFRLDNMVPSQGGVVFIFTDMGGPIRKDMY